MGRRDPRIGVLALVVTLSAASACDDEPEPVRMWAAASLTDVLPEVARAWRERPGDPELELSFDASSRAARQIAAGAPADLFFSADERWMDWLDERGLIASETRTALLGNRIVIAVPRSSALSLDEPADLASPEVERIALAGEGAPAGRYAEAALRSLELWSEIRARVIRGHDVRGTLAWVERGEVDAALVYRTDVRAAPHVDEALALPVDRHPPIVYPAAVVKGAEHPERARSFLRFCRSEQGRAIFEAAGFEPPPDRRPSDPGAR